MAAHHRGQGLPLLPRLAGLWGLVLRWQLAALRVLRRGVVAGGEADDDDDPAPPDLRPGRIAALQPPTTLHHTH